MTANDFTLMSFLKTTLKYPSLWGAVVPIQLFALYAIYTLINGTQSSIWLPAVLSGYFFIMIVGITMGYHRFFSHKSYSTNKFIEYIMLFFGVASGQGSTIFWTAVHRGAHHPYSDTDRDPHTPKKGFFHSLGLWLWRIKESEINIRTVVDLARDPLHMFIHKHYIYLFWLIHFAFIIVSFDLWLWFLVVPSFITFYSYNITNSLNHYRELGYRNFDTKDNSTNVWWLWPVVFGECWHNNHHGNARAYNFGKIRWWEVDPAGLLINLIKK